MRRPSRIPPFGIMPLALLLFGCQFGPPDFDLRPLGSDEDLLDEDRIEFPLVEGVQGMGRIRVDLDTHVSDERERIRAKIRVRNKTDFEVQVPLETMSIQDPGGRWIEREPYPEDMPGGEPDLIRVGAGQTRDIRVDFWGPEDWPLTESSKIAVVFRYFVGEDEYELYAPFQKIDTSDFWDDAEAAWSEVGDAALAFGETAFLVTLVAATVAAEVYFESARD